MINGLFVAIGGSLGAISRFVLSTWIAQRFPAKFPFGTLTVNLVGSFLLGLMIGYGLSRPLLLLFGTGFMGAFTTFSTFKVENIQLCLKKDWKGFFYYVLISYAGGVLLAFIGFTLGE